MAPLNILLIEDDEGYVFLLKKAISELTFRNSVTHVARMSDALQCLAESRFDIALTDLSLPDAHELESVEKLRTFDPQLPVVVLTSLASEQLASEALRQGSQDYIVKDHVTSEILEQTILHAVERQKIVAENRRLITELSEKNQRLEELVTTAHRFVDNVSHEFRTPLTVIREYASLLRDGALGGVSTEQAEFLDVVRYRIDDLNTMVDDMLDSSKLEAGIMGIHRQSVSPGSIVERPVSGLKLKASIRRIALDVEESPNLPDVFCDPEKIGRVITNLVANAIKFCDDNSGRIVVRLDHRPDYRDIEISVGDNGPGIPPDELQHLFERFRQLGTSTQSSTRGFGLGLNIARELVDQNFGELRVESEVGEGTTFRFTVPIDDGREILRRFSARQARTEAEEPIMVVRATIVGNTYEKGCNDIESLWRFMERQPDLVRKTGDAEWILLLKCSPGEVAEIIKRFGENHAQVSRNRLQPLPTLKFKSLGCFNASDDTGIVNAAFPPERAATRKPAFARRATVQADDVQTNAAHES